MRLDFLLKDKAAVLTESQLALTFVWSSSFSLGVFYTRFLCDFSVQFIDAFYGGKVTLLSIYLPILFFLAIPTFYIYKWRVARLIYLLAAIKGFCFGVTSAIFLTTMFSAGWLLAASFQFSGIISILPLFCHWSVCLAGNQRHALISLCKSAFVTIFICLIDYFAVVPFIRSIT